MKKESKNKLFMFYNTAPLYRAAIFRKIDEEYNCDWYFGETKTDIKEMDTTTLKSARYVKTYRLLGERLYWQCGLVSALFKKKYQSFFTLAETRAVSTWIFLFFAHLLFPKKRVYTWSHGYYGKETKSQLFVKNWMFKRMTGIFLYGNYAKQLMIKQGFNPDNIYVIHNSLEYDKQVATRKILVASDIYKNHFGNDYPVLIFIGRLTTVKRIDLLIDAVKKLKAKEENYNIVLVGDGVQSDNLKSLVKENGLENQVWFYGACYNEEENAKLIFNADLCVSPGNVGLTAMHSLVFGTPVLTHNNFPYQMPEFEAIQSGITGDFFEYENVDSLAESISKWFMKHKGERDIIRQNCYKEIDTSWNPYYQMDLIKEHIIM